MGLIPTLLDLYGRNARMKAARSRYDESQQRQTKADTREIEREYERMQQMLQNSARPYQFSPTQQAKPFDFDLDMGGGLGQSLFR